PATTAPSPLSLHDALPIFPFLPHLGLAFAADDQPVIEDLDAQVLPADARQVQPDDVGVLLLHHVRIGPPAPEEEIVPVFQGRHHLIEHLLDLFPPAFQVHPGPAPPAAPPPRVPRGECHTHRLLA